MGVACAGAKATKIDQDAITVSDGGKMHLATLKMDTRYREADLSDHVQDTLNKLDAVPREHEALWGKIEINDLKGVNKYLDITEIDQHQMYDSSGQTMIHRAASLGHSEIMMLLLERTGAKPDLVNTQLATPLHLACKNNRIDIAKFLIGCGVDANCQDEHGQTPILLCCIHGHTELAKVLIEASISGHLTEPLEVDLADHRGLTPLNCASIKGEFELVRNLVSRGNSNANQNSPKGCTPLMYAGRGGYSECVKFLLEKKASALKQDNAGGTVLHHAIEKGHTSVLETMLQNGVDIYSAIEIADNAGRTPIFEACENMLEDFESTSAVEIIKILTRKKQENGFGALVNVLNYTGQSPLFSAAREGNLGAVKVLIEAGAHPDLNNGELVKPEEDFSTSDLEGGIQEQLFMDAFKQCMTPLHVATVLGYEEITLYLIESGANVNLQTNLRKMSAMHLAVMANKPELLIELLRNTGANPMLEDGQGRTLLDMVFKYIPIYLEPVQNLLEQLDENRLNYNMSSDQKLKLVQAEDDRNITGVQSKQKIQEMYAKQEAESTTTMTINLNDLEESDIQVDGEMNACIESLFGRHIALCLIATNWQYKEQAMKFVLRTTEKMLTYPENDSNQTSSLTDIVDGSLAAVSCTCNEKVIKVFNLSLQLFNLVMQASRVSHDSTSLSKAINWIKEYSIIERLLVRSEESNTRVTNKIHESLLDLSYLEQVGNEIVAEKVLERIAKHNQQSVPNSKGLLAQLALLYKMVNSFSIEVAANSGSSLCIVKILQATLPSCCHQKDDIRTAAIKILVDTQRLTGAIKEDDLMHLPEKTKETIWAKLQLVQSEVQVNQTEAGELGSDTILQPKQDLQNIQTPASTQGPRQICGEDFEKKRSIIREKGNHRDWQYREQAFLAMQDYFKYISQQELQEDQEFVQQCAHLLVNALEDNNIQLYLVAIEVAQQFFEKTIQSDAILDSLPSVLRAVIMHSTDTNTRVRKRSIELINQVWESHLHKSSDQNSSQVIAGIITDATLNEKAILGRLGLFIKKALLIESGVELNSKPMHLIIGRDYEQLIEFACQWCLHKNTKVRQAALKLIVEVCRLNHIDPRGDPFKQRIVNYILGLRPSLRDPLVKKINEVCLQESKASDAAAQPEHFINENEMELSIATKHRALSQRQNQNIVGQDGAMRATNQGNFPQLGSGALPGIDNGSGASHHNQPTIVLPHSEPLSQEQKNAHAPLIELFGLEIITCLLSQTWSSRQAAIQKVEEQIYNLDQAQRDAMYGEINRGNMAPELSFAPFLRLADEGIRDPVLKNYLSVLELIQKALPVYFRYLRPTQVKSELMPLVKTIVQKTKDLKQKVREASVNFCLYLSHQSPIGAEAMINQVLSDLETSYSSDQHKDVQSAFGNSNLIASCLRLLQQYQCQTQTVEKPSKMYDQFALNINRALKHQNPQVRRAAADLFKQLFLDFGEEFIKELKDQKPQVQQKLVQEARAEHSDDTNASMNASKNKFARQRPQEDLQLLSTQAQIRDDYLNEPQIKSLLEGNEDKIQLLKMPNPKKRVQGIIELKKIIQKKFNSFGTQQLTQAIKDLIEPFCILMRHLLRDENSEVYLEALNLLKFIVSSMVPHMSQLDLHLMMGSFISVVLSVNSLTRTQVASDKVIIFFAKHNNIGSFVVAKEICKNIERLNKMAFAAPFTAPTEADEDKKATLARLYNILQMLISQFSIVLCYQPDFYKKMLEAIADTLAKCSEQSVLKTVSTQLIVTLFSIDQKLLEERVQSLDFTKKANIKKIIIELQNSQDRGNQLLFTSSQTLIGGERQNSPEQSFRDTQQSFLSQQTRGSIMSPSMGRRKASQQTQGGDVDRFSQHDQDFETRQHRQGHQSSLVSESSQIKLRRQFTGQSENMTGQNWVTRTNKENGSFLPDISDRGSRRRQPGMIGGSGKAAGFKSDFNTTANYSQNQGGVMGQNLASSSGIASGMAAPVKSQDPSLSQYENPTFLNQAPGSDSKKLRLQQALIDTSIKQERPPLYVPQKRHEPAGAPRDSNEGYQPSLLMRKTTATRAPITVQESPPAHVLLGSPIQSIGGAVESCEGRYRFSSQEAEQFQNVVPQARKQVPNFAQLGRAPPVATFEVKKVRENPITTSAVNGVQWDLFH